MDFEIHYTPEQESFRKEVRSWLDENAKVPPELGEVPLESAEMSREMWEWCLEFRRRLGKKGWLWPLWPKEYGGGGLTPDHEMVLAEEMTTRQVATIYDTNRLCAPALMVWGTEEQKQRLLRPILEGETITWQLFTEPDAGSDLASLKARAVRDGDQFVINGQKTFIGGPHDAHFLWTLAVTDPDAPRHHNLGAFYIPCDLPGITIEPMDLIVKSGKRFIYFDDVRVPAEYLIGGETQGWQAGQTTLEIEHGASGFIAERDTLVRDLIQYCKETPRNGAPLSKDPLVQQTLMDAYIDSRIARLIGLRNYWMFNTKQRMSYHGSQNALLGKLFALKLGASILDIVGTPALISDKEWGPLKGRLEVHQRESLTRAHPGGSIEIQKVIMARRMALSRTRERPAPTHAG